MTVCKPIATVYSQPDINSPQTDELLFGETAKVLEEKGIIRDCKYGLKVLANGELTKKLTIKAAAFSGSAKAKIEEAGGKAEVV